MDETLEIQASWAPGLHEALVGLGEGDFVIVDGRLILTDWIPADEPHYSQQHKRHGRNVKVIARPDGTPLWPSRATGTDPRPDPGPCPRHPSGLPHSANPGPGRPRLPGASATIRTPHYLHREQPPHYQQFTHDHARLRTPGECAFAQLKSRRILAGHDVPPTASAQESNRR